MLLIPNQFIMKQTYVFLFLLCSVGIYAQDSLDFKTLPTNEIVGFKLYPNPVMAEVVYVTTENNNPKEIRIYDVFGELVLKDRLSTKALDISRLSPGVYVVQVTENDKSITRKLVVK